MKKSKFKSFKNFEPSPVLGVDEVGRGCLAGPVYAAAAVLNSQKSHAKFVDSKTLSLEKREGAYDLLCEHHDVFVAWASVDEIERLNILWASMLAMKRAVLGLSQKLGVQSAHLLVDGNRAIPDMPERFIQTTVIKGDATYRPIAAASIAAKVCRDRYMVEQAQRHPEYEFHLHKGYSTPRHKELIAQYGPIDIHRKLFAGVREHLSGPSRDEQLSLL